MRLVNLFDKIAVKRLSAVETDKNLSHQHELNGVKALSELFGKSEKKKSFPAHFLYLDNDAEIINNLFQSEEGHITWYDARARHPTRTEYRLYYSSSLLQENASEGDLLIIGFNGKKVWFIIAKEGSTAEAQLLWLFNLRDFLQEKNENFKVRDSYLSQRSLTIIEQNILEQLGFTTEETQDYDPEKILSEFHGKFPSTAEFSSYARKVSNISVSTEDPDEALLIWWGEEEKLFRALERAIVQKQLDKGFNDVDSFIEFAKSVLNRRNSRAGHAFENHLAQIFRDHAIHFDKGKRTEHKSKPDFIFPSIEHYHKAVQNQELQPFLTMLAAKTSCKDRWRQITKEAKLISPKHLITLEPAISFDQTEEMKRSSVQLIVPEPIIKSYSHTQQQWLMNLKEFIDYIQQKEYLLDKQYQQ